MVPNNDIILKLTKAFQKFPGIGARQARRFVQALIAEDTSFVQELVRLILALKKEVKLCARCWRAFENTADSDICAICRNPDRQASSLLLVEKDVDLENIERAQIYKGQYYILGTNVSLLDPEPKKKARFKKLYERINEDINKGLKEVIIATSATSEGDATALYIERILEPLVKKGLKITRLGRGLSTGTELEYSDADTLRNAFENRK
jgi:recombination protein RecR